MMIRHFFLNQHAQIHKFSHRAVHEVLAGRLNARAFDTGLARELRLVTAVCHDDLTPQGVFLLRVPLTNGMFTPADRLVLRTFAEPKCVTESEAVQHHLIGWPSDLVRQLAVVMDVPVADVQETLDAGGPVFVAVVKGVSVGRAVREIG